MTDEKLGKDKYNELYLESESCDKDVFAEMRSNILLDMGKHFSSLQKKLDYRLRQENVPKATRIRLTKNHINKGMRDVCDIMSASAPGVLPVAKNKNERSDQKAAMLAGLVWDHGKIENNWEELRDRLNDNFVKVGEAATKTYFDPTKGDIKDYEQKVIDRRGEKLPVFIDPMGNETLESGLMDPMTGQFIPYAPAKDMDKPIMRGKVCIEVIPGFNLLRAKNATSIKESPYLIVRKMMPVGELKDWIKATIQDERERQEKLDMVQESGETTYQIFDGTSGSFQDSKGQVLVREFYFRQCGKYPRGWYAYTIDTGVLVEGELPFGEDPDAFPIDWVGFDTFETSARGFSMIKQVRPIQAEISRCASSIAETQLTIGYDKIILQSGAKFSRGVDQPGIRTFYATGEPQIVPGRSGEQFLPYMEHNIKELYELLRLPENNKAISQTFDARAELFKRQDQKARFTRPAGKLARFYAAVCKKYLVLAQKYYEVDDLIKFIGQSESADIAEFKNIDHLKYSVKLEEVSGDLDTMLGKSIEIETILQYMGKEIDKETASILISQFPILNKTQALKHITLEIENIESDLLALDRGEFREPHPSDNHSLFMKYLTNRMKQRDFRDLDPRVQQLYQQKYEAHMQMEAQQIEQIQAREAGFIPSGGTLAKADLYINPDPNNPNKVQRAVFPTDSLEWLKSKLEEQGLAQERLDELSLGNQADVSQLLTQQQQAASGGAAPVQGVPNGNVNPGTNPIFQ